MSGVNPVLMQIYGQDIGAQQGSANAGEREKFAQAAIVEQLLKDEGYDLEKLSAHQVLETATLLFGPNNDLMKLAEEASESDEDKKKREEEEKKKKDGDAPAESVAEKLAQAELSGQVMAHAFAREVRNMPSEAFGKHASVGAGVQAGLGAAGRQAPALAGATKTASAQPQRSTSPLVRSMAEKRAYDIMVANGVDPSQLVAQAQGAQHSPAEKIASAVNAETEAILNSWGFSTQAK